MTNKAKPESDRKRSKREYTQYKGLAQLAIELSGRKKSTVYGVLKGDIKSAAVDSAIKEARRILKARSRRRAA